MPDTKDASIWRAVKAALVEYGKTYPHTVAGKAINWVWSD